MNGESLLERIAAFGLSVVIATVCNSCAIRQSYSIDSGIIGNARGWTTIGCPSKENCRQARITGKNLEDEFMIEFYLQKEVTISDKKKCYTLQIEGVSLAGGYSCLDQTDYGVFLTREQEEQPVQLKGVHASSEQQGNTLFIKLFTSPTVNSNENELSIGPGIVSLKHRNNK